MKKVILILGIAGLFAFSSCSKCGTCSDQTVIFSGEYCKGNAVEDALYSSAEAECEASGGTFE